MSAHIFGTRTMRLIAAYSTSHQIAPVALIRNERAHSLCPLRPAIARLARMIRAERRAGEVSDDSSAPEGAWPRQEPK